MISRWLTPKKFVSLAARLRFCSNVEISGGGVVMLLTLVILHSERSEVIDGQAGSELLRSPCGVAAGVELDGMSGSLES